MAQTDIFPVDPDYPVAVDVLDGVLRQQSQDGRQFARALRADRRRFRLEFRSRPTSELNRILAFQRRMRDQVFLFHHKVWERGSWNLLGIDAEAEHSGTGGFWQYKRDGSDNLFVLQELGLAPGDVISISAELKTSAAGGDAADLRIVFRDADDAFLSQSITTTEAGTSYVLHKNENITVPAGAVYFRVSANVGGAETGFARKAKLNRGATAAAFSAPFSAEEYVPRFFAVRFAAPVAHRLSLHESNDIELELVEVPGADLLEVHYPDPLDLSTVTSFLEETEGKALAGTWTAAISNNAHGLYRGERTNVNTNTTDEFAFTYSGYGFRLWARKNTNLGILKVLLDGADLGNVDLYNAAAQDAAPLLTKLDVPLGLHTVKIQATNTKNASSSAKTIVADALEFMP